MTKNGKLIGAGIGLAALTAVGTYFMYGKRGAENRRKIAGWMLKMKGEVLEKVEELKEVNKEAYFKMVDETATRYSRLERVGASELKHLTEELKGAWVHLGKQLK
ncbi:MAG: hypothetical protein A3J79_04235 [Elusimicrobia bacterium RIFOXYB2_FULL_62_6]|nr:MAG: hypothetical protein A3J79_04235 [Elusimicrobia bacterium RIFOXYB2_FULL_62_6]